MGRGGAAGATFRTFAESSGNGFRYQDKPINDEGVARVSAARISQWLAREVLAGQDVLVDSPHLAGRLPSLLSGDRNEAATWNQTCTFPAAASDSGLDESRIGAGRFAASHWLSRPAWHWERVNNDEAIPEIADPWSAQPGLFAFCEDLSTFVRNDDARPFLADLASPYVRRYVADVGRLSSRIPDLSSIEYRPADRFESY